MMLQSIFRRATWIAAAAIGAIGLFAVGGCSDQPTLFANPDPALRKTTSEFKTDAATRFPYKSDVPHVHETKARAEVGYTLNRLEIVNFSDEDWSEVEVWVNRQYVCYVPRMESRKLKEIHFPMLCDDTGSTFPFDNTKVHVERLEVYRAGTMYDITCRNSD